MAVSGGEDPLVTGSRGLSAGAESTHPLTDRDDLIELPGPFEAVEQFAP
jgi:hypothetical protein